MGETGPTRRPLEWILLLLGWVVLAGPSGFAMYAVTTFLFAFSGGQYRMSPVVGAAPWVVSIGALLVGGGVLAASRSLPRALWAVLGSVAVAWPLAVLALWAVSFRLGSGPPCEPGQPYATIPMPVSGRDMTRGAHTATRLADGRVLSRVASDDREPAPLYGEERGNGSSKTGKNR